MSAKNHCNCRTTTTYRHRLTQGLPKREKRKAAGITTGGSSTIATSVTPDEVVYGGSYSP